MELDLLFGLGLAYLVFIGAMISPGPDFLIVMRNALGYSVRAGILTSIGIAFGLVFHMIYCVAGLGLLISQSIVLFNIIKWAGAFYLIFIGISSVRSKGKDLASFKKENLTKDLSSNVKSDRQAFMNGFITNLFNPKATMFFLALFSQMISPETPVEYQIGFFVLCIFTAAIWFSLVSLVMGIKEIRLFYARTSKWIDRVFGGFFIALGAKLAFSSQG
jgi:RhtB (resistance to homoserine/threonine) family protein